MEKKLSTLTQRILKKITPKKEEYAKIDSLSRELEEKILLVCQQEGVSAVVRAEGSVAKDTWLSGNPDIDIFMRLSTSIPRKNLGTVGLKIAKQAASSLRQVERFAEHPYLQVYVDGYRVDIVPCYNAKSGEWQSATDRTPYHTDYIKSHMRKELLGEVRLLKKFMAGIGVYGAELMVGGFSGYLCELLIMKYNSFEGTINAFAQYNRKIVIDIEGVYADRKNELSLLFPEPLVIVDPVDKGRNVASAVQAQKLYTFIGAAREFLKNPSDTFFYPPKPLVFSSKALLGHLERRGSSLLFLVIDELAVVPDVLWGQLYRTKRSIRTLLELNDFHVLRDSVWSNENSGSIFIFELDQHVLPNVRKHLGPPLDRAVECEKFLAKYSQNSQVISGPTIEGGRWVVELPRKSTNASLLLKDKLVDGGKNAGVADLIVQLIQKNLKILVNSEVLEVYDSSGNFAEVLTNFLLGKPFWLKTGNSKP
jgi:tRNA nucleotidyltransferase (CCA-adding enzyme)